MNLNLNSNFGNQFLISCKYNNLLCIEFLINIKSFSINYNILDYFILNNSFEGIYLLKKINYDFNELFIFNKIQQVINTISIPLLDFLIENGLNIFNYSTDGYNLLHYAALNDNLEIIKYLIKKGIDPNSKSLKENYTPLKLFKNNNIKKEFKKILIEYISEKLLERELKN